MLGVIISLTCVYLFVLQTGLLEALATREGVTVNFVDTLLEEHFLPILLDLSCLATWVAISAVPYWRLRTPDTPGYQRTSGTGIPSVGYMY